MTTRLRVLLVALFVCLVGPLVPSSALAQSGAPPWAACGRTDPESKPVKTYPVQPPVSGPSRTYAVLMCGNRAFGQRHIANEHGKQWSDLAVYTGGPWQGLADFAIRQTLTIPQPGYPRFNPERNTWTYKSPLQIKDQEGQVRVTYWVVVGVAAQDGKLLTSSTAVTRGEARCPPLRIRSSTPGSSQRSVRVASSSEQRTASSSTRSRTAA